MSAVFQGFGRKALAFFKALDFHQDKAWFEENRALYESEVLGPLSAFVTALGGACAAQSIPLTGSPKGSIFRIHRDVRFAKDKRPYKTHAGAILTRSGQKWDPGLFYIHIAPEGCFAATGFYAPEPDRLHALRRAMREDPARLAAMQAALSAAGHRLDQEFSLKRPPREAAGLGDAALVGTMKLTSLVTRLPIPAAAIEAPELVATCLAFIEETRPLLDYGWSILDRLPPAERRGAKRP